MDSIANSYAALNPGPELWERWVRHIIRLRDRDEVTDEQVQNLIYHSQAKTALFEVTHGDAGVIDDETVSEVLERFEEELRRPAELAAARERERAKTAESERLAIAGRLEAEAQTARQAEEEREELRGQVAELTELVKGQEQLEETRTRRRGLMRRLFGYGGAALVLVTFGLLIFIDVIQGKAAWASAVSLVVLLGVGAWAWGTKRDVKLAVKALIAVGAASALWFAVYAVVPDGHSEKPARHSPR